MKTFRFFIDDNLRQGQEYLLPERISHHIAVVRLRIGDTFRLTEPEGVWECTLALQDRHRTVAKVMTKLRDPVRGCGRVLAFSLLKSHAQNLLLEKAVELGVTHLLPVSAERSQVHVINPSKARLICEDAAAQCERDDLPVILPVMTIGELAQRIVLGDDSIPGLPQDIRWLYAAERAGAPVLQSIVSSEPAAVFGFIIGPEGGFTPQEHALLAQVASPYSLGSRILRAETAALASLAVVLS